MNSIATDDLERLGAAQLRRLVADLRAQNGKLIELSSSLQARGEREKASLARELHDSLGGILTPAKMDLAWLEARLPKEPQYSERMKRLGALIDEGIDLKRRIIEKLRPSLLDHLGLAAALQWHVDDTCRRAGIECKLALSETLQRLPPDIEIALFRLVQESIANVVEHARASQVELRVEPAEGGIDLSVHDNGVGIANVDAARDLSKGIAMMMSRVHALNGRFEIDTAPERGTRVRIFVPLS